MSPACGCSAPASPSTSPSSGATPKAAASLFDGALDGPQIAAILFVLAGAIVLLEHKRQITEAEPKRSGPEAKHTELGAENEAKHG